MRGGEGRQNYTLPLTHLPELTDAIPEQYQDDVITLAPGITAHAYRQPGERFPADVARAMYTMLVPVTSYAFGADMTGYWQARASGDYLGRLAELVFITDAAGRVVGWSGFSVIPHADCTIVYNDSSGVIPPHQRRNLMGTVFARRIADCQRIYARPGTPLYFATRTESPIIYKMRARLMTRLYPNPSHPTPARVVAHAKTLAAWLGQADKFDADMLIVRNAYDMVDDLYGELPASGDAALDAWMRRQLGPADAFLLMGVCEEKN